MREAGDRRRRQHAVVWSGVVRVTAGADDRGRPINRADEGGRGSSAQAVRRGAGQSG